MSNYLFISSDTPSELLVPVTPVNHELEAISDRLIYVPLATRNTFGIIKVGEGLNINNGLLSFDRSELDVKLSTNVGSENAGKFLYVSDTGNITFVDQIQNITKVSELENDVGYITNDTTSLVNYYDSLKVDQLFTDAITEAEHAKAIAMGKSDSKVFDTYSDMISWLGDENNKGQLIVGSNLFIIADNEPDYWVTEVFDDIPTYIGPYPSYYSISPLESKLPDISNMVTTDTNQVITANKTFTKYATFNDGLLTDRIMSLIQNNQTVRIISFNGKKIEVGSLVNVEDLELMSNNRPKIVSTNNLQGEEIALVSDIPTDYAKPSDIPTKVSQLENDEEFVKSPTLLYNYYTIAETEEVIEQKKGYLAQLKTDEANQRVSLSEKTAWNNKSDFSGSYNDLTNKPTNNVTTNASQTITGDKTFTGSSIFVDKSLKVANTTSSQPVNIYTSENGGFYVDGKYQNIKLENNDGVPTVQFMGYDALLDSNQPQSFRGLKTFSNNGEGALRVNTDYDIGVEFGGSGRNASGELVPTIKVHKYDGSTIDLNLPYLKSGTLATLEDVENSSSSLVLYNGTGQNTDGAMTQKASTDIFATKSDIPTIPTTLPNPYSFTVNGVSYNGSSAQSISGLLQDSGFSKSTSGYMKFSNGFIIQWRDVEATKNTTTAHSFPIAFPNACFGLAMNHRINSVNDTDNMSVYNYNSTTFYVANGHGSSASFNIIAVGY